MKINKIYYYIFLIGVIILVIFIRKPLENYLENKRGSEAQSYPNIEISKIGLEGRVIHCASSMIRNGGLLVQLSNDVKFTLAKSSYNFCYSIPSLKNLLQVGDSIYKPKNSDSIFIYKDNKEYYFILGEILNKQ